MDEQGWMRMAHEMIGRIAVVDSVKEMDAVLASRHFDDLDRMKTAAPQQWRAVTGFIEERRQELGP